MKEGTAAKKSMFGKDFKREREKKREKEERKRKEDVLSVVERKKALSSRYRSKSKVRKNEREREKEREKESMTLTPIHVIPDQLIMSMHYEYCG